MLNLLIAVIVGAMQTVAEQEHKEITEALGLASEHIEADMHSEMRALRSELQQCACCLSKASRKNLAPTYPETCSAQHGCNCRRAKMPP